LTFSLPIVLFLGLFVVLLVRKAELKPLHAVLAPLFGFLLASTGLATGITRVDALVAGLLGGSLHP
jgi:hypothetical protein